MKQLVKTYVCLFISNLFISTFTFGGGYLVVSMIRRFFVVRKQYFAEEDLIAMAAVAQSAPGAIAINLSALSGYKIAGITGAFISCFAAVVPPLVILALISTFYKVFVANTVVMAILKGMEAGVAALMVDLIIDMCSLVLKEKSLFFSSMVPLAFIANYICHINVAWILFVCCLFCILRVFYKKEKRT